MAWLHLQMQVLVRVPQAYLWLYAPNADAQEFLTAAAAARGVPRRRIIFMAKVPKVRRRCHPTHGGLRLCVWVPSVCVRGCHLCVCVGAIRVSVCVCVIRVSVCVCYPCECVCVCYPCECVCVCYPCVCATRACVRACVLSVRAIRSRYPCVRVATWRGSCAVLTPP